MTRPLEPRGGVPIGTSTPLVLVGGVWGVVAVAWLVRLGGTAASWLAGRGWRPPPFDADFPRRLLVEGVAAVWPGTPAWLVAACVLVVLLVALAPAALVARLVVHPGSAPDAVLASARNVGLLTPRAVAARAQRLRPSLAGVPPQRLDPAQTGLALGTLRPRGPVLRASWEDVLLAVMAPRAGKTTSLAIPAVLNAPGAVVATSNKADLWAATARLRAETAGEAVWVFDPQGITNQPQGWWWDPLRAVTTVEEAARLAGHFLAEVRSERAARDFWTSAAHDLLSNLLLAAACAGRSLHEVYAWLNDPVIPTPAALLRQHGHAAAAAAVTGRQHGAVETRDGVYETARTAAACLRDPVITAWVTRPGAALPSFDAASFVASRQTLHLLSKDGAGNAAPLVAALVDRVMRDGVRAAERSPGGRLDPPMVVVLDEAANICRIADLPDLYSHLGSRGVVPLTVLQSYRQGVRVWGEAGMDALWSAATVKVIGAGIDDSRFAEDVSRLIGDHDVAVRSYSDSAGGGSRGQRGRSVSTSLRRQRRLPPEDVRALPRGAALVLATGLRAALVTLKPHYVVQPVRTRWLGQPRPR